MLHQEASNAELSSSLIVLQIKASAEAWTYCWLFSVEDMRNSHLKEVRAAWRGLVQFPLSVAMHTGTSRLTRYLLHSCISVDRLWLPVLRLPLPSPAVLFLALAAKSRTTSLLLVSHPLRHLHQNRPHVLWPE